MIQPADVRGRFHTARSSSSSGSSALWAALPWVRVGAHPAVFVDVEARELFLFGATFNPQDTWLLFFLLTGVGFGARLRDGARGARVVRMGVPADGVPRRGLPSHRALDRGAAREAHPPQRRADGPCRSSALKVADARGSIACASLLIAHIVLSYFASLPKTFAMVRQSPSAHPEAFAWVLSYRRCSSLNFAWFREQLCVVLCPYGRLQSALLDEHSLVVGYDARRGEPRGKKGATGAGDCVDCKRCVVVCPTGIDIRNGMQMECVACTACIDACDDVMDRLGRPRGLVRYDSQEGLAGKPRRSCGRGSCCTRRCSSSAPSSPSWPRAGARDFEVTLLRLPGAPYTMDGARCRNALQLHLVNKRAERVEYRIEVEPADGHDRGRARCRR